MKITKVLQVWMMVAFGLATFTGCISFGGKAVAPLTEAGATNVNSATRNTRKSARDNHLSRRLDS